MLELMFLPRKVCPIVFLHRSFEILKVKSPIYPTPGDGLDRGIQATGSAGAESWETQTCSSACPAPFAALFRAIADSSWSRPLNDGRRSRVHPVYFPTGGILNCELDR